MLAGGQDQQYLIIVVASDSALCIGEGLLPRASHNLRVATSRAVAKGIGPKIRAALWEQPPAGIKYKRVFDVN
jgi:hypothetical protein